MRLRVGGLYGFRSAGGRSGGRARPRAEQPPTADRLQRPLLRRSRFRRRLRRSVRHLASGWRGSVVWPGPCAPRRIILGVKVLAHYEEQTEAEAVAEDEAAFEEPTQTVMEVPTALVPVIRELIARHHA